MMGLIVFLVRAYQPPSHPFPKQFLRKLYICRTKNLIKRKLFRHIQSVLFCCRNTYICMYVPNHFYQKRYYYKTRSLDWNNGFLMNFLEDVLTLRVVLRYFQYSSITEDDNIVAEIRIYCLQS